MVKVKWVFYPRKKVRKSKNRVSYLRKVRVMVLTGHLFQSRIRTSDLPALSPKVLPIRPQRWCLQTDYRQHVIHQDIIHRRFVFRIIESAENTRTLPCIYIYMYIYMLIYACIYVYIYIYIYIYMKGCKPK